MSRSEPTRDADTLDHIEEVATQMVADRFICPDDLETARILLGALHFKTVNADRLASILGLQRDFVRVRARRLRENGVWVQGKYRRYYAHRSDTEQAIEFLMHLLCADGDIVMTATPEGVPTFRVPPKSEDL